MKRTNADLKAQIKTEQVAITDLKARNADLRSEIKAKNDRIKELDRLNKAATKSMADFDKARAKMLAAGDALRAFQAKQVK